MTHKKDKLIKQLKEEGYRIYGLLTELVSVFSIIRPLLNNLLTSGILTQKERMAIMVLLRLTK